MSSELHHPHDAFFRRSLANLDVAKDLLQTHLPPELVRRIDWNTLKNTNKSYVKAHLKQLHSDVVYQCQLDDKQAYIYCAIEHQSTPDPMLPFRILQYNVALMEEHLAQGHKRLPTIVNLCLYAGQKSPYPYSTDIYDCFDKPTLAKAHMFKPLDLIDLTSCSEEELSGHGQADLLELLLKQSQAREFLIWIKSHPALVQRLLERVYGVSGIFYILGVDQHNSAQDLIDAMIATAPQQRDKIMTAAQQLERRGMQTRTLDIARNMLKAQEPKEKVMKFTSLKLQQIEQLLRELTLEK